MRESYLKRAANDRDPLIQDGSGFQELPNDFTTEGSCIACLYLDIVDKSSKNTSKHKMKIGSWACLERKEHTPQVKAPNLN
jgi:hypothetical protein